MSNKERINELDTLIRNTLRLGMDDGTFLRIEFFWGFERFNTRPYHNYETWSGGYRVFDTRYDFKVEHEDLDDALKAWAKRHTEERERARKDADVTSPATPSEFDARKQEDKEGGRMKEG